MRRIVVMAGLFLALTSGAPVALATVVPLAVGATGVRLESGEAGRETLLVEVGEVRVEPLEVDGRAWAVVRVAGASNLMERGRPSLPYLGGEYLLGAADGISLELLEAETRTVDLNALGLAGVAPSKGHFNRTVDPDSVPFELDPQVYGGDRPYPGADAWVDAPFIAGPLRGQAFRLPLARWRPQGNLLEVVVRARYQVVRHDRAANPRLGPQPPLTGLFDLLARERSVNYRAARDRYVPFVESGRLLILTPADFLDEVQPLVDWETKVGYPTVVETVAAGVTASQVMNRIQTYYDQPEGLAWVILVGDYQQIPNFSGVNEGAPCDPCYTKLEGADNRPDAAISRLSAQVAADLVTQVDKILTYEQLPGTSATWYTAGFGIGGDDSGGSPSYIDWERVEMLRADLMVPAYTFTEFDQIYHDPGSASAVTAAVNDGRSLGVYIGHGWSGGWSTTGFDTGNVNALVNGEMLPSIWSVACNNGQFHDVGECFAEAWLRRPGGGAVSFEGGTTSESWVPPCDGQRGIVDSIRNGVAFTTGGQQVNGKLYCMDLNGAANGDEGTKWMEQSTLFGSCVMWPRTVAPVPTQEPDDFAVSGGVASLTVKLAGGAPFAKANGAIVSFYTLNGGTVQPLGSGLVDDSGVVHAAVTGDPTHCHIHGADLVPAQYELAARPSGRVSLDRDAYACDDLVTVRVVDSNVGSGTVPVQLVGSGGGSSQVVLTEDVGRAGFFTGTASLGSDLAVGHGDTLLATYVDADDGAGGTNLSRTDSAAVDCQGPAITDLAGLEAGAATLTVGFTTSEPATAWAEAAPGGASASDPTLQTSRALVLAGLDECTSYTVSVGAADALGNESTGGPLVLTTGQVDVALDDDVEAGVGGWVVDTATDPGAGANWGVVTDAGAPSPTHSWFSADESGVKDDRLVAGPFTLGGGTTTLTFAHHFDLESSYDGGVLEVSTDGGASWQDLLAAGGVFTQGGYTGTLSDCCDNPIGGRQAWHGSSGGVVETVADLSALAGTSLSFRFRLGCDYMMNEQGWWVDDVVVETTSACANVAMFADGFESGSTAVWSVVAP